MKLTEIEAPRTTSTASGRSEEIVILVRAVLVWFALLAVAVLNGMLRVTRIIPIVGDKWGHVISTVMLSAAILGLSYFAIGLIRPATSTDTVMIGSAWLSMTLTFEFLAGHFLFRRTWATLFEDYNLAQGRIWVLVLVATALAPYIAATVRELLHRHA
jgi:hypothetical protein